MSPLRTGCAPTWKATSSTASMANMVFLLSRGILSPLSGPFCRRPRCYARRSEAAGTPRRLVELADLAPDRPRVPCHNQLCNSHAARDLERLLAQIDQNHAHFAAILGIDSARPIGHRHAVPRCETRTRPYLGLEAYRQGNRDPGRNDLALQWPQLDLLVDGGHH